MLNERLQTIIDELPLIKQLYEHEVYLTVIDSEGIVQGFVVPDGVTPKLRVGELFIDPSGAFHEVISTGRAKKNRLPKEVMGEPFEGMLVPIKDGSEIVGCVTCTYSVNIKERNVEIASKFEAAMREVSASIQETVGEIEKLFHMLTDMDEMTNSVEHDVNTAAEVVGKIRSNASRSNILALNASIEAARSGEYGRGFAVVATEMGKLANDSGSSATAIKATLSTITEHLVSIIASIKDANDVAKGHLENVNTIQKVLEDTIVLAEQLEENVNY